MPDEVWKPVPGWRDTEASSGAGVRLVPRRVADGRPAGYMVLTPSPDRDGYPRVRVGRRWLPVHVAVCLAFHGRPEVRHIDGDRSNASPSNLCWGSHRENERDKKRQKMKMEGKGLVQGTAGTSATGVHQ